MCRDVIHVAVQHLTCNTPGRCCQTKHVGTARMLQCAGVQQIEAGTELSCFCLEGPEREGMLSQTCTSDSALSKQYSIAMRMRAIVAIGCVDIYEGGVVLVLL